MTSPEERFRLSGSSHQTTTESSPLPAGQLGRRLLKVDWIAVALVAAGVGLRLWLTIRGWPALDSDEGIIGLMGRHILYGGERPVFYYGQHYMGALEAYAAAAVFRFLGATPFALRLAISPLTLGFLITMYFLGRAAFGRITGLITLAFLALGPAYGLLRELPAVGGYQETLLFGALLPLLVYVRLRTPVLRGVTADGTGSLLHPIFGHGPNNWTRYLVG